ncbi:lipopolysaccharide biosynthesis protein [Aliarcobacter butzleri]|uniref:lipopolysaccharide biosynthesis protein n=1 Tax=Aliarcobacter butzleri TaxID=28197 RepID=UPI00102D9C5F|nr:lipopolysaccharide biosynthesis protein [Aliarcobacter butzleri]RZV12707.1 lipopolysaccharide biosynthesis protein [Aliarcobacter butzleri]
MFLHFINKIIKSNFLKESFIYGLSSALSKFSVFFTIPIYTRYLTVEEFGLLDLYITISMILYIVLEMQMQSGFMRSYYEKQKENKLDELLGTVLKYYFIVFGFFISFVMGLLLLDIKSKYLLFEYLLPIVLFILPKQIFDLNNIMMRMEHQAKKFLLFNVSYVFSIALLGIFLVVFVQSSVEMILWSMAIGNIVFGIIAFRNLIKHIPLKLNLFHFKEVFYYGAPIVPAVIGGWAMSAIGRFIIAENMTLEYLGIYSLALKIGMIFLIFVEAFRLTWSPFVVKKYGDSNAIEVFAKALNYYVFIGLAIVALIYLSSPLLIKILASDKYISVLEIIPILLMAYFWQGAINIIAVGNGWVRKTYLNSIGSLSGGIFVLLITYYYINLIGIKAAAIGQLIGFIVSFFVTMYFAQKNINIAYSKYTLIIVIFLTVILIIQEVI